MPENMGRKPDKQCKWCKSKFALTEHHTKDKHLNRDNPEKSNDTIVLCETCHYFADFIKSIKCFTKAEFKRYKKQMDKLENNYKKYHKNQINTYNLTNNAMVRKCGQK